MGDSRREYPNASDVTESTFPSRFPTLFFSFFVTPLPSYISHYLSFACSHLVNLIPLKLPRRRVLQRENQVIVSACCFTIYLSFRTKAELLALIEVATLSWLHEKSLQSFTSLSLSPTLSRSSSSFLVSMSRRFYYKTTNYRHESR